mmetsp:Transcript_25290/g.45729  ORF Transcript_25290/g.45729 Transcript_25290/m.45729 type:complete len:402 (+) Transcript_25290:1394-2599(+)
MCASSASQVHMFHSAFTSCCSPSFMAASSFLSHSCKYGLSSSFTMPSSCSSLSWRASSSSSSFLSSLCTSRLCSFFTLRTRCAPLCTSKSKRTASCPGTCIDSIFSTLRTAAAVAGSASSPSMREVPPCTLWKAHALSAPFITAYVLSTSTNCPLCRAACISGGIPFLPSRFTLKSPSTILERFPIVALYSSTLPRNLEFLAASPDTPYTSCNSSMSLPCLVPSETLSHLPESQSCLASGTSASASPRGGIMAFLTCRPARTNIATPPAGASQMPPLEGIGFPQIGCQPASLARAPNVLWPASVARVSTSATTSASVSSTSCIWGRRAVTFTIAILSKDFILLLAYPPASAAACTPSRLRPPPLPSAAVLGQLPPPAPGRAFSPPQGRCVACPQPAVARTA